MLTPDDIHYAIENTKVILPPRQQLATFGTSLLNYHLITEEMDQIDRVRVREGQIHAERPQLMSPSYFAKLMLEGFGDEAEFYADQISSNAAQFAFLKYGFRFKKSEFRSYDVTEPLAEISEKIKDQVLSRDEPLTAVLTGVDDGWEVCLVKFMCDVIGSSAPGNINDFRGRGLL